MKKLITVLFLSLLLTACSGQPRGEYDESKEWNHYVLQMVVKEAEAYVKESEKETNLEGKAAEYYYRKAMNHIPKGFNDDDGSYVYEVITLINSISDNDTLDTKIELMRIKGSYDLK